MPDVLHRAFQIFGVVAIFSCKDGPGLGLKKLLGPSGIDEMLAYLSVTWSCCSLTKGSYSAARSYNAFNHSVGFGPVMSPGGVRECAFKFISRTVANLENGSRSKS